MSSNSTSFQSGTQKPDYQKWRHFDVNMIKDMYTFIMQNKRTAYNFREAFITILFHAAFF